MLTIYKYVIPFDEPKVRMHTVLKYLHVDNQNEQLCLWALVDTETIMREYRFTIAGTGEVLDSGTINLYIGTALFRGGLYVWHLFERI